MSKLDSTFGASSSKTAAARVFLAVAASTCVCCTLPMASAFVPIVPSPLQPIPSLRNLRSDQHALSSTASASLVRLQARRRRRRYDDDDDEEDGYGDEDLYYDDDGYAYDDEGDYYDEEPRRRRSRRRPISSDDLGTAGDGSQMQVPSPFGLRSGLRLPDSVSKAVLAGIFVLGIGTGVTIDSQINTNPKDLASRDAIDQNAPNPVVCARYGASAMAFDQRVFVSFNPFNVYVAQADVKPACVLRQSNVVQVLQQSGLINDNEVRACKRNMNTWAFVGELDDKPQLSCVYQSEDAQNEFLSNPKLGIGEDVYDDDRAKEAIKRATGKLVKGGTTEQQSAAAAAAKKIAQETSSSL